MLNYKQYGEHGSPLLILHGLFGSLDNWQTLAKKLAEDFLVYSLDLPNHGKSVHTDEFSYAQMAQAVQDFCKDKNLEKVHVIGHSMGGKTAMTLVNLFPSLIDKLVVVDIAPKKYPPHHDEILGALFHVEPASLKSRKEAEEKISEKISNTGVKLFLLKNLARKPEGGYRWKMNLEVLARDINKVIDETKLDQLVSHETLFIRGGLSNYILDGDSQQLKKQFPHSKLVTIDGAGHWVHAEKPAELLNELTSFLK